MCLELASVLVIQCSRALTLKNDSCLHGSALQEKQRRSYNLISLRNTELPEAYHDLIH